MPSIVSKKSRKTTNDSFKLSVDHASESKPEEAEIGSCQIYVTKSNVVIERWRCKHFTHSSSSKKKPIHSLHSQSTILSSYCHPSANQTYSSTGFNADADANKTTTNNPVKSPSQRGIIRQPRRISFEIWECDRGDHDSMEGVDQLQNVCKHNPVRRGFVCQARRMTTHRRGDWWLVWWSSRC